MSLKIKDAPLVDNLSGSDRIPIGKLDNNLAQATSVDLVKNYILSDESLKEVTNTEIINMFN